MRSRCQSQVQQMVYENDFEDYMSLAKSLLTASSLALVGGEGEQLDGQKMVEEWNEEVEVSTVSWRIRILLSYLTTFRRLFWRKEQSENTLRESG